MSRKSMVFGVTGTATLVFGLLVHAVTVHSVPNEPIIHRVTANNNDLDGVEGTAPPGKLVELWYKQRNFKEGHDGSGDPFSWCSWKNRGTAVRLGQTVTDAHGLWRFTGLREHLTVMLFPPSAGEGKCGGGVYTELLPRVCDTPGVNCTAWTVPTLHWLDVTRSNGTGRAAGSISGADNAAIAVADGPDDGPTPSSVHDVDQNRIDTTAAGFTPGQRITWRCGAGGTAVCPSVTIHDASTVLEPDPEFGFLLATMHGHRPGGSVFAAAAGSRPLPLGFQVNVNVRIRGQLDINLGCDQPSPFDFSDVFTF